MKHRFLLFLLLITVSQGIFAQGRPSSPFLFSQEISSPYVTSFAEDPDGYIWIGTNHGLNRYNGSFYDVHYTYSDGRCLQNDNISKLLIDEAGDLWMLTEAGLSVRRNGHYLHFGNTGFAPVWQIADIDKDYLLIADNRGVEKINKKDLSIAYHYKSLKVGTPKPIGALGNGAVLMTRVVNGIDELVVLNEQLQEAGTIRFASRENINKIICDKDGSCWVVTNNSVYLVTPEDVAQALADALKQTTIVFDKPFAKLNAGMKMLFVCNYDDENLILGAQNHGLFQIDKKTARMKQIMSAETLPLAKYECYVDSHRNIWLADGNNGFSVLPSDMPYEHLFFTESNDTNYKRLCFDKQGRLWVRSSFDLICYDPETKRHYSFTEPNTFYGDIFVDDDNRLWSIEKFNELKCYEIADNPNNEVGVTLLIAKHYYLGESAFTISQDSDGRIWATLADHFAVIDADGTLNYEEGPDDVNFTSLQAHGNSNRMFLYTVGKGIYEYKGNGHFAPIGTNIPNSRIVFDDEKQSLWIGSSNQGLARYDEQTNETEYLLDKMAMGAYDIKAIEKDLSDNIWFSTSTMLFRYNPADNSILSIHDDHLSYGVVYNLYSSAIDKHGRIYFGGTNGLTVVNPTTMKSGEREIPIRVEDIVIGGDSLYEYDGEPFVLPYNRNNIVFWFSGLDFSLGKQLSYEYMLEGFDKAWQPVGLQTRLSFSQLDAGKYNLKIRVKAQEDSSTFGELSVPFAIKPAPWLTIWAKLLYIILLLALAFFGLRHLIRWRLREARYALLQQREAVNSEYVRFVTNISHEFRTPLSMMYGPMVEYMQGKTFEGKDKELLDLVIRNTERLKTLTEEVMKAGKDHHKEKQLSICDTNIVINLKMLLEMFGYLAKDKNISLDYTGPEELRCPFDNEKLNAILGNLLSNAIKYTPVDGHVMLEAVKEGKQVKISVKDDGIGIPEEQASKLFQKFERLGAEERNPQTAGSGIGLYYSNYLAQLHHGQLSYAPNLPKGSIFAISIPSDIEEYNDAKILSEEEALGTSLVKTDETDKKTEKEGTLYVVEDNADVAHFLQLTLGSKYNIILSTNGAEAWDNLKSLVPDLIISDLMMPVMDGKELCRKIKDSNTYGHIPVILLTAISDPKQEVECMESGADAFVQKPFNPRNLLAKIDSIIANRRRLQNLISSLTSSTVQTEEILSPSDKNFLQKFYTLLDEHLDDEGFAVENMSRELGIGEAKLYAKVKTLTGQTPKAFFVTYRMNKAMELLKSGEYTVSEVGYKVGATSPAVFSRSFKHQFGISPSSVVE